MTAKLLVAYGLDLLMDDPRWFPHPVRGIGRVVSALEPPLRRLPLPERASGALLVLLVVGGTWAAAEGSLRLLSGWARWGAEVVLLGLALAARGLGGEAMGVHGCLGRGDLEGARRRLSGLVSRDTEGLPPEEVVRAAVETVAENTVDGVISPLFWAALGGAPLAWAFKAASTLDSMVGYRDERYLRFGWASARLDDLLNWLPARICGLLLVAIGLLLGRARRCLAALLRDAPRCDSPNSGIPEAGFAALLGVRLGGPNRYGGRLVLMPHLGDAERPLELEDIRRAVRLMHATSALFLLLLLAMGGGG